MSLVCFALLWHVPDEANNVHLEASIEDHEFDNFMTRFNCSVEQARSDVAHRGWKTSPLADGLAQMDQTTFSDLEYQGKKRQTCRELVLHALENQLHKAESVRLLVGLRHSDPSHDETNILNFRHLLERHELDKGLFDWEQGQGAGYFR